MFSCTLSSQGEGELQLWCSQGAELLQAADTAPVGLSSRPDNTASFQSQPHLQPHMPSMPLQALQSRLPLRQLSLRNKFGNPVPVQQLDVQYALPRSLSPSLTPLLRLYVRTRQTGSCMTLIAVDAIAQMMQLWSNWSIRACKRHANLSYIVAQSSSVRQVPALHK